MLTPEAAWEKIVRELRALPAEEVDRIDAAARILAAPVTATVDMPQADVSAMDGYICCGDTAAGSELPVVGTAAAGTPAEFTLKPGQAAKIMTGAVVPAGGDRVVPIEQTDGGVERVRIDVEPGAGAHIRRCGEVVQKGRPMLDSGHPLTAASISLLASHGYSKATVVRQPRVTVMTTGDEVVPPETEPGPGQLRDSNTSFLLAAGRSLGLEFRSLGIAGDQREDLRTKIRQGLESDVLLLCGGVSKGDFDFVEEVLEEVGCRRLFEAVRIQPGKPLVASVHPGGWVFGLPGNPASVMMTFWLFVRPLLHRLQGREDDFWHGALKAELAGPLPPARGRDRFLSAEVEYRDGRLIATPAPPKGSHDVACYARGSAVVRVHRDSPAAQAGDSCELILTGEWPL